jgi:hypothetical protein
MIKAIKEGINRKRKKENFDYGSKGFRFES